MGEVSGVVRRHDRAGSVELFLDGSKSPQVILAELLGRGITVNRFEVATPPLHDIFLEVVEGGQ